MKKQHVLCSPGGLFFFALLLFSIIAVGSNNSLEGLQSRTHYWEIDQEECNNCGQCYEIAPDCFEEDETNEVAQFICPGCSQGECSPTCGLFGTQDDFMTAIAECPMKCINNVSSCP
jgi:ferredoxin